MKGCSTDTTSHKGVRQKAMSTKINVYAKSNLHSRCDTLQKYHQFFSIIVQIIVGGVGSTKIIIRNNSLIFFNSIAVIVILRTYALYELNKRVAIGMATVAFLVICFGVVSLNWLDLPRRSNGANNDQ